MIAAGPNGSAPVMNVSWCSMGTGYEFGHGSNACTVGYSIVALFSAEDPADASLEGEYRHTQWVGFNTPGHHLRHDWSDNAVIRTNVLSRIYGCAAQIISAMFVRGQGSELYRHEGSSSEQLNLVDDPRYAAVVRSLSQRLRAGPTTGGGWGLARIKSDDVRSLGCGPDQPDLQAHVRDREQPHRLGFTGVRPHAN